MMRKLILLALVVAVVLPAAACGRKGPLEAPEGSEYPRTYPAK